MDLDVTKQRRPFPNLALMKLSAYYKAKGDEVFLNFPLCRPDIAYASCVFTWHSKGAEHLGPEIQVAGSGIDLKTKLPPEVEHIRPDYDLYPGINFSLGFTSRGCPRRCPWCIVPEKEGPIEATASIYEFWDPRHRKILLLDNNNLASPTYLKTFADIYNEGLIVDFYQGLDIRFVNEEIAWWLARLRMKTIRFAFDNLALEPAVRCGIEMLTKAGIRSRKLSFYVLIGFDGADSGIERMKILYKYNVDVYPMIYKGPDGKTPETTKGSLKEIARVLGVGEAMWHGSRRNISKFLRVAGRLPE